MNFFFFGGGGGGGGGGVPKRPCFLYRYLQWLCLAHLNNGARFMQFIFALGGTLLNVLFWGECQSGVLFALGVCI